MGVQVDNMISHKQQRRCNAAVGLHLEHQRFDRGGRLAGAEGGEGGCIQYVLYTRHASCQQPEEDCIETQTQQPRLCRGIPAKCGSKVTIGPGVSPFLTARPILRKYTMPSGMNWQDACAVIWREICVT